MSSKSISLIFIAFLAFSSCTEKKDKAKPDKADAVAQSEPHTENPQPGTFDPTTELQKVGRLGQLATELEFNFDEKIQAIDKKLEELEGRLEQEPRKKEFSLLADDFEKNRIELLDLHIATQVRSSEYDLIQYRLTKSIEKLNSECLKSTETCNEVEPFIRALEQLLARFTPRSVDHDFSPTPMQLTPLDIAPDKVEEQVAVGLQSTESFRGAAREWGNRLDRLMKKMSELEKQIIIWGSELHSVE